MVFIIAEIGVNWDGDLNVLRLMVENAKMVGCNAVKFQAYKKEIVEKHPESSRLMKSAITEKNIDTINDICNEVGIEWFCTPMYPEAVDFLEPFVNRFKLREFDGRSLLDNSTTKLFERIKKTGKEIIVSSQKSPKNCKFYNDPQIKWLYCVPKYPCDLNEINFKELFDFDGYSNHCTDIIAPITSAVLGAKIIEVHVTPDKSKSFVDNPVSFDNKELILLVESLRKIEKINF
jgi:N,N'-diacetyllegionaminate synthase